MSRTNPKLEQYKRVFRSILEASGEVFCAQIDAEFNIRLGTVLNVDDFGRAHAQGVMAGLKIALDLIRSEYRT